MFKKKISICIVIFLSLFLFFSIFNPVSALDLDIGLSEVSNEISLGAEDPRVIGARIINIAMAFLGLIAVTLIIYAGFLWMTAGGAEEKVETAKKVLKNSIIGLIIILASWGITTFVLGKLISATNPSINEPCATGESQSCGCGGIRTCTDGVWGACIGSNCGGDNPNASCDGNPLTPACDKDNSICSDNYFCNNDCYCQKSGEIGDSCDSDTSNGEGVCDPDNLMCSGFLECNPTTCLCEGSPVISSISPFGGFCENDINQPCESNEDCTNGATCDLVTPNGSVNSFISISGQAFDENTKVFFTSDEGEIDILANNPDTINSDCSNTNTSNLIIVAVPDEAVEGPIKVVDSEGREDVSNNDFGPVINDFKVNNIDRPGLCKLNPEEGKNLDSLDYYGNLLNNSEAYFGNYNSNILAYNNAFSALSGSAQIPNIQSGDSSTFVRKSLNGVNVNSNIFDFTKLSEEETGPYINSFFPDSGPSSQYVTIYGGGFGDVKGSSSISFYNSSKDLEANYIFPEVCTDTVWSDNRIIVKVPDSIENGTYAIKLEKDSWLIKTQSPNLFTVNQDEELSPSLCKIQPQRGPVNSQVTLYGEYFGDIGNNSTVIFSSNVSGGSEVEEKVSDNGDSQFIEIIVPNDPVAISGPVKVKNNSNSKIGNSIDFIVGECTSNSDCSPEVCCPEGSTFHGRCVAEGENNNIYKNCFPDIHSSVFQWSFETIWFNGSDYDSCLGMAQNIGSCQDEEFCPNSPGQCSTYAGGNQQEVGFCKRNCENVSGCTNPNSCEYDVKTDRCKALINNSCSLSTPFEYKLGEQNFNTIKTCNANKQWQIQVKTSCPDGWTNTGEGVCVDKKSNCNLCDNEFTCIDDDNNDYEGICFSDKLCPNNSYCNNDNKCIYIDSSSCDCCCRKGHNEEDCCSPLTCEYTCGSDDGGETLGVCSGCNIPEATTELKDDACNCLGTSGKYCETTNVNYPTGICVDCSRLSDTECLNHKTTCCWDSGQDSCVGGDGTLLDGKCAYYNCDTNNPTTCNDSEPLSSGDYRGIDDCVEGCANSVNCEENNNFTSCVANTGCCWDVSSGALNGYCTSGNSISSGSDIGKCDYYKCDESDQSKCDVNPLTSGPFKNIDICNEKCQEGYDEPSGAGKSCTDEEKDECNTNFCINPFSCINPSGFVGSDGDCGYCCCEPNPDNGEDKCKDLNNNLICLADKGSCSGENRGLCCGCTSDFECDNGEVLGCGIDTCCYARPEVVEEEVFPNNFSKNVCRNIGIKVPFDQTMKNNSFSSNFLLLQELVGKNETCPSGTVMLAQNNNINDNWWRKVKRTVVRIFEPVLNTFNITKTKQGFADNTNIEPNSNRTYCKVSGSISREIMDNGNTALYFTPNKILEPSSRYYGVVLGDKDLNSMLGVLSQEGVGLNGKGFKKSNNEYIEGEYYSFNNKTFANSHIWTFITLSDQEDNSGVCEVDYIRVNPSTYLFQNTIDDLNENDIDMNDPSFDTAFDRDKLYSVAAYSRDGQKLIPVEDYSWSWAWKMGNTNVAKFEKDGSLKEDDTIYTFDNKYLVSVIEGVQKGETTVKATIKMSENNSYKKGDNLSHTVPLYVFACNNPWPAPNPITHAWEPWKDSGENCKSSSGDCFDYNYTFFYCRDAGSENSFDDLPALVSSDNEIVRGSSKVCSLTQEYCNNNNDCPKENSCNNNSCVITGEYCDNKDDCSGNYSDNECIDSVLKEYYFFREDLPGAIEIKKAKDTKHGGEIRLGWVANELNANGFYKLYYKRSQDSEFQYLIINSAECSNYGSKKYCEKVINNLDNNTMYYFSMSIVDSANVESVLSNQVSGKATDAMSPAIPRALEISK